MSRVLFWKVCNTPCNSLELVPHPLFKLSHIPYITNRSIHIPSSSLLASYIHHALFKCLLVFLRTGLVKCVREFVLCKSSRMCLKTKLHLVTFELYTIFLSMSESISPFLVSAHSTTKTLARYKIFSCIGLV